MAYIRKRKLPSGKVRWQVIWDTVTSAIASAEDQGRDRGSAMFDSHVEAKAKLASIQRERPKTNAPLTELMTHFLAHFETLVKQKQREASSLRQYRQHIFLHILSDKRFATLKCGATDTVAVQFYLDRLILRISHKLAVKVRTSLNHIFDHGKRRGFVTSNPVDGSKIELTHRPQAGAEEDFYLPPKADLKSLLRTSKRFDNNGKAEAVIRTLMFGGLRMSELRGLYRECCTLASSISSLRISRRADRYNELGAVKSAAGLRTIEIGQETSDAITAWIENSATRSALVFPNEEGNVWSYPNFWNRFWVPLMNEAGLVTQQKASRVVREWSASQAEYRQPAFGPHTLRHVYASLQIEQGVTPKRLQKLMGHSTLKLTLDTYGHLWPDESEDRQRARNVEKTL